METLSARLRSAFASHGPSRIMMVEAAGGATCALDELDAAGARVATALLGAGVKPGDYVATLLPNSIATCISYLGIWKAGAVPVPINVAYTLPEIEAVVRHAEPTAAIVTAPRVADLGKLPEAQRARLRFGLGDDAIASLPPAADRWPTEDASDDALVLYSSGTTGNPKGIVLGHPATIWGQDICRTSHAITPDDVMLGASPYFHIHGLLLHLLQSMVTGNRLIVVQGMEAPKLLRLIGQHRVTVWKAVPALLDAILAIRWDDGVYDPSSLKLVTSGTAPASRDAIQRALERLGNPAFREADGATDVGRGWPSSGPCRALTARGPWACPSREPASRSARPKGKSGDRAGRVRSG
jgi:long-chain acyl-CoA synthetase